MGYKPPASLVNGTHAQIVQDYIANCRQNYQDELDFFAKQRHLRAALAAAAASNDRRGKRLSHQRRIVKGAIPKGMIRLLRLYPAFRRDRNFDQLHRRVTNRLNLVKGLGPLYNYDVSLRIGAFLGLWPKAIYIHSGSLAGAKKMRPSLKIRKLSRGWFPLAYRKLKPHEIENLLCVYEPVLHP